MYIASIILYVLCICLGILAALFLGISWWVPLFFALIPLAVLFGLLVILAAAMLFTKPEKEEPAACTNCLFKDGAEYDPEKQCLGEHILKESHIPGVVCPYYRRKL